VHLVINRETGQWGTGYQARHDIARVLMTVDTVAGPVEEFTIRVDSAASASSADRLVMEWGRFRWGVAVEGLSR
jgi:hypothetical protein